MVGVLVVVILLLLEFHHLGLRGGVLVGSGVAMNVVAVWMLLRTVDDEEEQEEGPRSRVRLSTRLPELYMEDEEGGGTNRWPANTSDLTGRVNRGLIIMGSRLVRWGVD